MKKGQIASNSDQVKVLAVFGKDTRINTKKDWLMLEERLAQDSNALLININKPKLDDLCDQIDKHKPQILFFAGHSRSEDDGESGFIDLNDDETITIDDLEPDLRKAVKRGLQLAIFNSCDGLGIARQLAQLHVPNIIVMREPVPDQVAQMFLQRFLEAFAAGKPLHLAVRRARERINRLENQFPGATWLPMTFQNPAEPPLTWRSLGGVEIKRQSNQSAFPSEESNMTNQGSIAWLNTEVGSYSPPTPLPIRMQKVTIICNKGHQNSSDNRFCIHCGEALNQQWIKLSITCSQGHENSRTSSFCSYCGEDLKGGTNIILPTTQPQLPAIQPETELPPKTPINSEVSSKRRATVIGNLLNERYRILKILSKGAFSETFIAEDINLPSNPQCVVKQLKLMTNDPQIWKEARRLFFKEAEVLEKLGKHDQIPVILAYFEENYEFYLVQEYIEGHTLTEEIYPGKRLAETQVTSILHDILKILEFVHQQNIIHRDVKPSNLIRRKQDQKLVLIDFGAVKQIQNSTIEDTIIIGTPAYMPSEQMEGKPYFNSDIYAVGIMAIEALTGISPRELRQNSNAGEIFWRDYAQVSDELAAILDKMVCYDFKQRYQSATEVLQALKDMQRIVISPTVITPNPTIISGLKSFFNGLKL
ncbi:MAG: protein kinase [Tolypothrix carrinoi HA7290-LM1]|nr:protein kinase [Tolypothrix carrinoi HA7290-LM1]